MDSIHYLIVSIFTYALEALVLIHYCEHIFSSHHSFRQRICGVLILYTISSLCSGFQNMFINVSVFFISTYIVIHMLYNVRIKPAFLHTSIITLVMIVTELVIFAVFPDYGIHIQSYVNEFDFKLLIYVLSKFMYFCVMFAISHFEGKKIKTSFFLNNRQFLLLLGILAIFCFIITAFVNITVSFQLKPFVYRLMFACSISMILVALLIIEIYYLIQRQEQEKQELKMQLMVEKELVDSRAAMVKQDENQKIFLHDIKKHLLTIDSLCNSADSRQISDYVHNILNSDSMFSPDRVSDNELLNAIVGRYIRICKERGITFHVDIRSKTVEFLSDYDCTSLFCNLLDNALEAVSDIENSHITLNVRPANSNSMVLVNVVNSCSCNPFDEQGNLTTTKVEPSCHGYGIKSIQRIASQYNGHLHMYYDKDTKTFHSDILFILKCC